ncbi:MAG: glycerophosphodiester phosphodiesterase [Promethearchaeota archaeon]
MSKKSDEVLIIGHRGAKKIAPENTIKAFEKAIELKADYIEFDVHLSKDNEIIIMHDGNTFRTTGHFGLIRKMTLDKLKQLDAGEGEKVPTLDELIEVAKNKIKFQLEIKATGMAEKVVEKLRKAELINSTIISSFKHDELLNVQKIEPSIKLASLVMGIKKKKTIQEAIENKFYSIHPLFTKINRKFIENAHKQNIKVNAWNVNSKKAMQKLIDMGIDGIVTNDIELAKKVLKRV